VADRKRRLSALPNLSPHIYDVKISGFTRSLDCRHAAAIQEHVTAVLQSIPKETFADSFQKLYERCQSFVVKDGDYFEGQ
jgi:methylmalonyl-CoA mutase cobalamin-binding subunit